MSLQFLPLWCFIPLAACLLAGCSSGPPEDETAAPTEVAVEVGKVVRTTLCARVDAYGVVEGAPAERGQPAGVARLSAPETGLVWAVPAQEGQRVEPGAVVVKLDDRAAVADVEKARRSLEFAEQQWTRQNRLREVEGTSEKLVQDAARQLAVAKAELESAQARLARLHLSTPLGGVVARICVRPGETVEAGAVVAEVLDPERLEAAVSVPVAEVGAVRQGQQVELWAEGTGATPVSGKVLYVSPQVDARTATARVRVAVPPEAGLRSGQFVRARIITEERPGRLAVPRQAVYTDHDGQSTLSTVEGELATQRVVKTGLRDGDLVEVEGEGVSEGVTVVTLGSYALPKETRIRILNSAAGVAR